MSIEKDLAQKALQTVKKGLWQKYRPYVIGGGVILLIIGGIFLFQSCKKEEPAQPVTFTSQEKAQTPQGVTAAADAAKVPISAEQAQEAANAILAAAGKAPDSIVKTTGANLQTAAAKALANSGGDFAMITDPKHPNQTPVLVGQNTSNGTSSISYSKDVKPGNQPETTNQTDAIKPEDTVVLNQYNIQDYPKHLTVGHIGVYSAGVARLNKVDISPIPLFLPKGGVGYVGPYVGVTHDRFQKVEHVDFGISAAF